MRSKEARAEQDTSVLVRYAVAAAHTHAAQFAASDGAIGAVLPLTPEESDLLVQV